MVTSLATLTVEESYPAHSLGVFRSNLFNAFIACLVVFTATLSFAAETDPDSLHSIGGPVKAKIDALVREQVTGNITPGIAIAIEHEGKIIYKKSEGVRNLSSGAPMLIETPQAIGSITKQFTAAAILLLQQENMLSIDALLSKYVPEFIHRDKITLRQMLNMASGISDDDPAIYGDHLTQPITREQMFKNLNNLPLKFAPGSHMAYTNTNYNLLGLIVERVSGQPYLTFLKKRIFGPLGMSSSSTIDQPPPDIAMGYFHEKPGQPFESRPEMDPDFSFGTGNLVSTPLDLLKWDAALLSKRLLNEDSLRIMFTVPGNGEITTIQETDKQFPVIKNISDGGPTVYAMGWMVPTPQTRWHGGHTFLFESTNVLFSDGYNIVIIGNVRDAEVFEPENLAARIHNLLNPDLIVPPLQVILRPPSSATDSSEVP